MSEVTRILSSIEQGDPHAAEQLLPLVYDELRKLAAQKLAHEKPGQTLQPTALVHEAYLRLVGKDEERIWDSRGHFFAAAAEAMRRILIERARHKVTLKRGGQGQRLDLDKFQPAYDERAHERFRSCWTRRSANWSRHDAQAALLVKLRYYGGLSHQQAAEALGVGRRAADRLWALARAWLYQRIGES